MTTNESEPVKQNGIMRVKQINLKEDKVQAPMHTTGRVAQLYMSEDKQDTDLNMQSPHEMPPNESAPSQHTYAQWEVACLHSNFVCISSRLSLRTLSGAKRECEIKDPEQFLGRCPAADELERGMHG